MHHQRPVWEGGTTLAVYWLELLLLGAMLLASITYVSILLIVPAPAQLRDRPRMRRLSGF
ncbi:hypothetical protein [Nonomuraea rhodomycinica]|uniref:hypothetical protein n=1 Tax=Nonomuraea rhodomycinica TaxID=1712872 RepID=UPI001C37637A|nr:hypothetical protein [Nonomuraea rhodomycinica]